MTPPGTLRGNHGCTYQHPGRGARVVCSISHTLRSVLRPLPGSTPISPPYGPATGSSNGLHRESNFLAVNVTDEMKNPTVSGNMRNIAILALSVIPTAKAGVLVIANPDATYIASTTLIPITGTDYTEVTSISDGIATVTFSDVRLMVTVPLYWGSWSSPPNAESSTPRVLFSINPLATSLTFTFNEPLDIFGVEVEPNNFAVYQITANFFNGAQMVGSFSQGVNGSSGARLFAAQATSGDECGRLNHAAGHQFVSA